jgi:hypothetical protein
VENVTQTGSDQLKRRNCGNRDQGGDQAVFDCRGPMIVLNEPRYQAKHLPTFAYHRALRAIGYPSAPAISIESIDQG